MSFKKAVLGACICAIAGNVSSQAYEVEQHFLDDGQVFWTVSFFNDLAENLGAFDVVHNTDEEEVFFDFISAEGVTDSCFMDIETNEFLYNKSVELSENLATVDSYTVFTGNTGGICVIIDDIEYRTDIIEPEPAPELTDVEFNCEEGYTVFEQTSVYVVGNTEALGNWDPAKAIKLDPIYYPHWQLTIPVESNQDIEWKCIIRDEHNPDYVVRWEEGYNNLFNSGEIQYTWGRFIDH